MKIISSGDASPSRSAMSATREGSDGSKRECRSQPLAVFRSRIVGHFLQLLPTNVDVFVHLFERHRNIVRFRGDEIDMRRRSRCMAADGPEGEQCRRQRENNHARDRDPPCGAVGTYLPAL